LDFGVTSVRASDHLERRTADQLVDFMRALGREIIAHH
jgi:hypothetical protein